MITKIINGTRGAYFVFCCALVTFHILDMLSTEYILNHGKGSGLELNPVAAYLQQGHGIVAYRTITIILLVLSLLSCKLSKYAFTITKHQSAWKILIGTRIFSSRSDMIKLGIMQICIAVSISRLIAATSNLMGEFLGFSIPIMSEKMLHLRSNEQIYIASILISFTFTVFVMALSWEIYRRRSLSVSDPVV